MTMVLVATFGVVGVFSRYYSGLAADRYFPAAFPYGTFLVNLLGAFLIGFTYVFGGRNGFIPAAIRTAIIVGFLGGFTTFSSYCLDAIRLIEEKEYRQAICYFLLSPGLGILGAAFGIVFAHLLGL